MTNAPAPVDEPVLTSAVAQAYEKTGIILVAIGIALGLLRAFSTVATGPGGWSPWFDAGHAFLLHLGVALLVAILVRGVGVWLSLAERRARIDEARAIEPRPSDAPTAATTDPPRPIDPGRWREWIDAAREAGDAARVLELRETPPDELDEAALKDLDAELGKWLLSLVHRRLRSGPLQADLVTLVERGSETLGHTREGASLRAALPTLRRGAGLCPRCARPYAGVWEACPECMGRPEPPPPIIPGLAPPEDDGEDEGYGAPPTEGRWFIDPDVDGRPGG